MNNRDLKRSALIKKAVATLALTTFFVTNHVPLPAFAAPTESVSIPAPPKDFAGNLKSVQIPKEFGKVENFYQGNQEQTVIIIQDAHEIPDAQKNIFRLIRYFQKEYGVSLVGLEGADASLDTRIFKSFPDKKELKKAFGDYFNQGELTGGSAAAIFSDFQSEYHGVEDWKLFELGLGLYLASMQREPDLTLKVETWKKDLDARKEQVYPKNLIEIDRKWTAFQEDQGDLPSVLKLLAAVKPPENPEILAVLEEISKEGKISPNVELEVKQLAEKIKKFLSYQTTKKGGSKETTARAWKLLTEFNRKYQLFQTSSLSAQAFALFLKQLAVQYRIPVKVSQELLGGMKNQRTMKQMEGTRFFTDLEKYVQSIKDSLMTTEEQRQIDRESTQWRLAEKWMKLELSRDDWEKIKTQPLVSGDRFGKDDFKIQNAFYKNAEERDRAFLENLEKTITDHKEGKDAILVAGGFHAQGLQRRLKEKKISYLLVMPEISSIPKDTHYRDHMKGEVSWKKYFTPENGKINLYKAFVRGTRDKLLATSNPENPLNGNMLKNWRDQIIRDLADRKEIEKAGNYTKYLDELVSGDASPVDARIQSAMKKVENFIAGLRKLDSQNQLTDQNIQKLFTPATVPATAVTPTNFVDSAAVSEPAQLAAAALELAGAVSGTETQRPEIRSEQRERLTGAKFDQAMNDFIAAGVGGRYVVYQSLSNTNVEKQFKRGALKILDRTQIDELINEKKIALYSDGNSVYAVMRNSKKLEQGEATKPVVFNNETHVTVSIGNNPLFSLTYNPADDSFLITELSEKVSVKQALLKTGATQTFRAGTTITAGRNPVNDIIIDNGKVSRFYLSLASEAGGKIKFSDLFTENGIEVEIQDAANAAELEGTSFKESLPAPGAVEEEEAFDFSKSFRGFGALGSIVEGLGEDEFDEDMVNSVVSIRGGGEVNARQINRARDLAENFQSRLNEILGAQKQEASQGVVGDREDYRLVYAKVLVEKLTDVKNKYYFDTTLTANSENAILMISATDGLLKRLETLYNLKKTRASQAAPQSAPGTGVKRTQEQVAAIIKPAPSEIPRGDALKQEIEQFLNDRLTRLAKTISEERRKNVGKSKGSEKISQLSRQYLEEEKKKDKTAENLNNPQLFALTQAARQKNILLYFDREMAMNPSDQNYARDQQYLDALARALEIIPDSLVWQITKPVPYAITRTDGAFGFMRFDGEQTQGGGGMDLSGFFAKNKTPRDIAQTLIHEILGHQLSISKRFVFDENGNKVPDVWQLVMRRGAWIALGKTNGVDKVIPFEGGFKKAIEENLTIAGIENFSNDIEELPQDAAELLKFLKTLIDVLPFSYYQNIHELLAFTTMGQDLTEDDLNPNHQYVETRNLLKMTLGRIDVPIDSANNVYVSYLYYPMTKEDPKGIGEFRAHYVQKTVRDNKEIWREVTGSPESGWRPVAGIPVRLPVENPKAYTGKTAPAAAQQKNPGEALQALLVTLDQQSQNITSANRDAVKASVADVQTFLRQNLNPQTVTPAVASQILELFHRVAEARAISHEDVDREVLAGLHDLATSGSDAQVRAETRLLRNENNIPQQRMIEVVNEFGAQLEFREEMVPQVGVMPVPYYQNVPVRAVRTVGPGFTANVSPKSAKDLNAFISTAFTDGGNYDVFVYKNLEGQIEVVVMASAMAVKAVNGEDVSFAHDFSKIVRGAQLSEALADKLIDRYIGENPWVSQHPAFNREAMKQKVTEVVRAEIRQMNKAEFVAFARTHLDKFEKNPLTRRVTGELVDAFLNADAPSQKVVSRLGNIYYDGLDRSSRDLTLEEVAQARTLLAILDKVVPHENAEFLNEPEINLIVSAFMSVLAAYENRNKPAAPVEKTVEKTDADMDAEFIQALQEWNAQHLVDLINTATSWEQWLNNPEDWLQRQGVAGAIDPLTRRNLPEMRKRLVVYTEAYVALKNLMSILPPGSQPSLEMLRQLYEVWDELRDAGNQINLITADSNRPDVKERGLVANIDKNSRRAPGELNHFVDAAKINISSQTFRRLGERFYGGQSQKTAAKTSAEIRDAKTGAELAAKLRQKDPFFNLSSRDIFVLTELLLRGVPAALAGIQAFEREFANVDISKDTGENLIQRLYQTGAIQEHPDSQVRKEKTLPSVTMDEVNRLRSNVAAHFSGILTRYVRSNLGASETREAQPSAADMNYWVANVSAFHQDGAAQWIINQVRQTLRINLLESVEGLQELIEDGLPVNWTKLAKELKKLGFLDADAEELIPALGLTTMLPFILQSQNPRDLEDFLEILARIINGLPQTLTENLQRDKAVGASARAFTRTSENPNFSSNWGSYFEAFQNLVSKIEQEIVLDADVLPAWEDIELEVQERLSSMLRYFLLDGGIGNLRRNPASRGKQLDELNKMPLEDLIEPSQRQELADLQADILADIKDQLAPELGKRNEVRDLLALKDLKAAVEKLRSEHPELRAEIRSTDMAQILDSGLPAESKVEALIGNERAILDDLSRFRDLSYLKDGYITFRAPKEFPKLELLKFNPKIGQSGAQKRETNREKAVRRKLPYYKFGGDGDKKEIELKLNEALKKTNLAAELKEAGVKPGDEVRVYLVDGDLLVTAMVGETQRNISVHFPIKEEKAAKADSYRKRTNKKGPLDGDLVKNAGKIIHSRGIRGLFRDKYGIDINKADHSVTRSEKGEDHTLLHVDENGRRYQVTIRIAVLPPWQQNTSGPNILNYQGQKYFVTQLTNRADNYNNSRDTLDRLLANPQASLADLFEALQAFQQEGETLLAYFRNQGFFKAAAQGEQNVERNRQIIARIETQMALRKAAFDFAVGIASGEEEAARMKEKGYEVSEEVTALPTNAHRSEFQDATLKVPGPDLNSFSGVTKSLLKRFIALQSSRDKEAGMKAEKYNARHTEFINAMNNSAATRQDLRNAALAYQTYAKAYQAYANSNDLAGESVRVQQDLEAAAKLFARTEQALDKRLSAEALAETNRQKAAEAEAAKQKKAAEAKNLAEYERLRDAFAAQLSEAEDNPNVSVPENSALQAMNDAYDQLTEAQTQTQRYKQPISQFHSSLNNRYTALVGTRGAAEVERSKADKAQLDELNSKLQALKDAAAPVEAALDKRKIWPNAPLPSAEQVAAYEAASEALATANEGKTTKLDKQINGELRTFNNRMNQLDQQVAPKALAPEGPLTPEQALEFIPVLFFDAFLQSGQVPEELIKGDRKSRRGFFNQEGHRLTLDVVQEGGVTKIRVGVSASDMDSDAVTNFVERELNPGEGFNEGPFKDNLRNAVTVDTHGVFAGLTNEQREDLRSQARQRLNRALFGSLPFFNLDLDKILKEWQARRGNIDFKAPDFGMPDFKTPDFKMPDFKQPQAPGLGFSSDQKSGQDRAYQDFALAVIGGGTAKTSVRDILETSRLQQVSRDMHLFIEREGLPQFEKKLIVAGGIVARAEIREASAEDVEAFIGDLTKDTLADMKKDLAVAMNIDPAMSDVELTDFVQALLKADGSLDHVFFSGAIKNREKIMNQLRGKINFTTIKDAQDVRKSSLVSQAVLGYVNQLEQVNEFMVGIRINGLENLDTESKKGAAFLQVTLALLAANELENADELKNPAGQQRLLAKLSPDIRAAIGFDGQTISIQAQLLQPLIAGYKSRKAAAKAA